MFSWKHSDMNKRSQKYQKISFCNTEHYFSFHTWLRYPNTNQLRCWNEFSITNHLKPNTKNQTHKSTRQFECFIRSMRIKCIENRKHIFDKLRLTAIFKLLPSLRVRNKRSNLYIVNVIANIVKQSHLYTVMLNSFQHLTFIQTTNSKINSEWHFK